MTSSHNIIIKGNQFHPDKGVYNNFDTITFSNQDDISPIVNIYNITTKGNYKLSASSGYIMNPNHPKLNDNSTTLFDYILVYPGSYHAYIVDPIFNVKAFSFVVSDN
jgi:hypothetical protein